MSTLIALAKPKLYTHRLVQSIAMTTPAVRMVVIDGWDPGPDTDNATPGNAATYPVLAIRAEVADHYSARDRGRGRPDEAPTHAGMVGNGWSFEEREIRETYLIHDEDYGTIDIRLMAEINQTAWKVVVCDWPQCLDEQRLAPVIAEAMAEAKDLARVKARDLARAKVGIVIGKEACKA